MKNKHKLLVILLGSLLPAACILFSSQPAAALSRVMPDPNDMSAGSQVYVVVSRRAQNNALYAPFARVNIYVTDPDAYKITIQDAGFCDDQPDAPVPGTGVPTRFRLYRTDSGEGATSTIDNRVIGNSCPIVEMDLTNLVASAVSGHEGFYVAQLDVTHLGDDGEGKVNGFKVRTNDPRGIVGYTDNGGNAKFALQDRIGRADPNSRSNFELPFAPDCSITRPTDTRLWWFDDDWQSANQVSDRDFRTELREYRKSDGVRTNTWEYLPRGGDQDKDEPEKSVIITVRPGHRYVWEWEGVSRTNGIQFRLPYDSFNYFVDCNPIRNLRCADNAVFDPAEPSSGQSFEATVSVRYQSVIVPTRALGYRMSVRINGLPAYRDDNANFEPATLTRASFTTPKTIKRPAGTYTVTWRFTGPNDVDSGNCTDTITVTDKPYFRVYGGDVIAGSNFMEGSKPCSPTLNAGIIGWNRGSQPADLPDFPTSGPYGGAGVQLAAFALGTITNFTSAAGRTISPVPPKGLSFANTNIPDTGIYGGQWSSDNITCATDYFVDAKSATPYAGSSLNREGGGALTYYKDSGNLSISGGNGSLNGAKRTVYVNGDVHITSPIRFVDSGNYTGINDIPSVRIIARNIYIAPGVRQIDAILIAQTDPNRPTETGTIYTCSNSAGNAEPSKNDMNSVCRNKLTINGAMIGRSLKFFRTAGSLQFGNNNEQSDSGNIAELIQYGPEVWLASPGPPAFPNPYDAFTSLPPIL